MPVQVLQLLFSSCETEEECRNVVAECLGHLALLYPSKTLPLVQQQSQVRGQDSSDNPPPKRRRLVWSCHTLHGCQLCKCDTICSLPCACCLSTAYISFALLHAIKAAAGPDRNVYSPNMHLAPFSLQIETNHSVNLCWTVPLLHCAYESVGYLSKTCW